MNKNLEIIEQFLPANTGNYVLDLLKKYPVKFKIVKPRKSKLGDFKASPQTGNCQITINNNLEPLNFLITTLHEIAHLYNWKEYGRNIAPHGKEWKQQYIALFQPILNNQIFSEQELSILRQHLSNPKASSSADKSLSNHFKKPNTKHVNDLQANQLFELNGKIFKIEKKLRTRYLCTELNSQRKYYVNGLAIVQLIKQ